MKGYKLKRKQKRSIAEISVSAVLFASCAILDALDVFQGSTVWRLAAYMLPYLVIGWRVLFRAARNIAHGQVFDEHFLMSIATIGALVIGEYPEAVFVMLFYRVGELFEQIAVGKSRGSIAALMEIRPDVACVERGGECLEVSPEEVLVGEIILVKPGEKISLDGEIIEGCSSVNTVALTGESVPRDVSVGDGVLGGFVNMSGPLRIRVSRGFSETTVSKILALVESATDNKSKCENFITKFARYYTPTVVIGALLLAVIPPLLTSPADVGAWSEWIYRAMSFLVISCPCALVISVPMTFFGGIGRASAEGILIKGSNYMEALATCDTVLLDKTGTLTSGVFAVSEVSPSNGYTSDELLLLAASAERYSDHPIACALRVAADDALYPIDTESVSELVGRGVSVICNGKSVAVGNARLMDELGVSYGEAESSGSVVYVSVDGAFAGYITVSDRPRHDAADGIRMLKDAGVERVVMLTGDREAAAREVARELGIDEYTAELLPDGKMARLEEILAEKSEKKGTVAFVGDGINDAPALARADIGIAMGGIGSDAAIEAADVVLMDDSPKKISRAVLLARKTLRIVKENIVVVLFVKALALILGAVGVTGMWFAVFADVGISVIAILNSLKISIIDKGK